VGVYVILNTTKTSSKGSASKIRNGTLQSFGRLQNSF